MDNLISRYDVLATLALSEMTGKLKCGDLRIIMEIIEQMPSAQEWIPVTERLPEENGRYLVTNSALGIADWNAWVNGEWLYPNGAISAWMPLPEPYEEAEE